MHLSCYVRISEWIHILYLPECQGTPCLKQTRYLKFKWLQLDSNPNGWVFIYELSGCGFKSSCSHLNWKDNVSWHPDPHCYALDEFNFSWKNEIIYAFPPFSMTGKSISKIIKDQSTGIMIAPWWPIQNWFLWWYIQVLTDHPIKLPATQKTLELLSNWQKLHPLFPKLQLLAVLLSGKPLEQIKKTIYDS